MSPRHAIKPPSPNQRREGVRARTAARLAQRIAVLRANTRLEQSELAMALQETKRRKRLVEKAAQ